MNSHSLRTFFAVRPPGRVIELVAGLVTDLKSSCAKLGLKVAWVPERSMHITLKFLGDVAEDAIPAMVARVNKGLDELALPRQPRLSVQGLHAFPNLMRPKVLVATLAEDTDPAADCRLGRLQAALEGWLQDLGHPREERPFVPHLTVGRVRAARAFSGRELTQLFTSDGERRYGDSFPIEELILYESRTGADGTQYVPLHRLPLQGNQRRT